MTSLRGASTVALVLAVAMLVGCGRGASPEDVAREWGRGLYATDADALWPLVSAADRKAKAEATFRRQQRSLQGFTRDAVQQLARYITARPVKTSIAGERATVTLRFRLPDANAPDIRTLVHDWDEQRLETLPAEERRRIVARLKELHRAGRLPTIEGDETIELVREAGRWKVLLNWARGVRVTFAVVRDPGLPLDVTVSPSAVMLAPGERVRVSIRATNTGARDVTTRVSHRIAPEADANHLALLECPLLLPARVGPRATREYESEYMLLADVPPAVKELTVTYRFPAAEARRP